MVLSRKKGDAEFPCICEASRGRTRDGKQTGGDYGRSFKAGSFLNITREEKEETRRGEEETEGQRETRKKPL